MSNLFRKLPKIDILMKDERLQEFRENLSYNTFYTLVKNEIDSFRESIKSGKIENFEVEDIIENITSKGKFAGNNRLKKVINGSGVIIHTNLGRSVLNKKVVEKIVEVAENYNNLEYDLETGKRGHRNSHVEELICKITGAEGALVVNNNAAAVIICLNEFAKDKSSIVSRGELVEIGGSFRIPDIMELSGSKLREVGTTNKTNFADYERAIDEETALILKVHRSNFKIMGFTDEVGNKDIARLGKERGIVTMEDLGSGVLVDFSKYGVVKEATVQESIASGIDIVTISGDKLLGGPQCGIILASAENIARLKRNQYLRAFRVDKLVLSALESTLKFYLDEREAIREIPTLRMITEDKSEVLKRAEKLQGLLKEKEIFTEIIESRAKIGGGSMPEETVPSYALVFNGNPLELERYFRTGDINIIGRIAEDSFILDVKTIRDEDMDIIVGKACKRV
jgi:L-seryl-tRNA(Ser) seleniumtransferase